MKKFLLLMAGATALASSAGQQLLPINVYGLYGVYKEFTVDKAKILYNIKHQENGNGRDVILYNSSFAEVASFNIPTTVRSYLVMHQEREYGQYVSGVLDENEYVVQEGLTYTTALEYLKNIYSEPKEIKNVDGEWLFIYEWLYLDDGPTSEYPTFLFVLKADGILYQRNISYDTRYDRTGPWGEEESRSYDMEYSNMSVQPMDFEYDIDADLDVSQTLFNTDASWEYLTPIIEERAFNRVLEYNEKGEPCVKEWGTQPIMVGFNIVSQTGQTLNSVRFEHGFYTDQDGVDLYLLDGKKYLAVDGYLGVTDRENAILLCEVDGLSNGIQQIKLIEGASVSPRAMQRSTPVTVTLSEPARETCRINVVSASGSVVYSTSIHAGASTATISTDRFAPGLYIVNVQNSGTIRENCKIVVR